MQRRTPSLMVWMGAFLFCSLSPALATAGIVLGLDDATQEPIVLPVGTSPYGFDPTTLTVLSGPNFPEQFDLHGEYLSNSAPANGVSITVDVNIYEDAAHTVLSDTFNVVFTGIAPTPADANNVAVDMHFRSDMEGGPPLPPLTGGINVLEQNSFMPMDPYVQAAGGPGDFHVSILSAIPEPSSVVMMGLGAIGLGGLVLRRRRES
jgi:hypothetical protein